MENDIQYSIHTCSVMVVKVETMFYLVIQFDNDSLITVATSKFNWWIQIKHKFLLRKMQRNISFLAQLGVIREDDTFEYESYRETYKAKTLH